MTTLQEGQKALIHRPDSRFMLAHPAHMIAQGFGSGLSPIAPGTVGSLFAWLSFNLLTARWPDFFYAVALDMDHCGWFYHRHLGLCRHRPQSGCGRSWQHGVGRNHRVLDCDVVGHARFAGHAMLGVFVVSFF